MSFNCKMCGKCCEGKGGIVLDNEDINKLIAFFHIDKNTFLQNYTYKNNKKIKLLTKSDYCIFYDKEKSCLVHKARPKICQAWPYFRGNIVDEISYNLAKEDCLGIDRNQTHSDFKKEAIAYLLENNLISSANDAANAIKIEKDIIFKVQNDY